MFACPHAEADGSSPLWTAFNCGLADAQEKKKNEMDVSHLDVP